MIWDQDMGPQGSTCFSLAEKDFLVRRPRIRGNPNTRYGLYLPLNLGGPVKSLTVFCTVSGISCIQINGDAKARLGKPSDLSCSLTHHLGPGELVENLYAITRGTKDPFLAQGPYLLVNENLTLFTRA
jgi:hypothetical protein